MAIEEMLREVKKNDDFDVITIESDNCSGPYKSSQHFHT